jgi:hypothetical protein
MRFDPPVIREIAVTAAGDEGLEIGRVYRAHAELDGRRYTLDARLTAEPPGDPVEPDDELTRTADEEGVSLLLRVIEYLMDELKEMGELHRRVARLEGQQAAERARREITIRPPVETMGPWGAADLQPTPARPGFYTEHWPGDVTISGAAVSGNDEEE